MSHTMPITSGLPAICDFGSARIGTTHTGDVMPGQYRAPEVILDMAWDTKIDIWALGLIVRYSENIPSKLLADLD